MVSEGGGAAACGAASRSIGATKCASCAGAMGKDCATRSAAGTRVAEANGCTFSCVPNEANVGSGLLGAAALGGAGGWNAAAAIGAAGVCTGVVATCGSGAAKGAGVITACAAGGASKVAGVDAACTGAGFLGASGITAGAAGETAGSTVCAAPSDGK